MNWVLIMVVTALYTQGGTRSVDVTMERFGTEVECRRVASKAYGLVKKHERSPSAMEYACIRVSKLGEDVPDAE